MRNMFLKSVSFGSKECTKELKVEGANFLVSAFVIRSWQSIISILATSEISIF